MNSIVCLDNEIDVVLQSETSYSPLLGHDPGVFGYVPQKPEIFLVRFVRPTLFEHASDTDSDLLLNKFDLVDENSVPLKLDMPLGHRESFVGRAMPKDMFNQSSCLQTPVLLLDEVTSALDAEITKKVLEEICSKANLTVLWVTHDPLVIDTLNNSVKITDGIINR